jgi:hypothetical protein
VVFLSSKFEKHLGFLSKCRLIIQQTFEVILVGFLVSFIFLYFVAFMELNILSILVNINPQAADIVSSRNAIVEKLRRAETLPDIKISTNGQSGELIIAAASATGNDSFYGKFIIPSIPGFFIIPVKGQNSGMVLTNNTLIIKKADSSDIKSISPLIGYLLIKKYFTTRSIKHFPQVELMNDAQYLESRKADAKENLADIDKQIKDTSAKIASDEASIDIIKNQIEASQENGDVLKEDRNKQYTKCLNTGSYVENGVFKRTFTVSECQDLVIKADQAINRSVLGTETLNKKLEEAQGELTGYKYYSDFFKAQRELVQGLSLNIPHETGVFKAPNEIKMLFKIKDAHALGDFFETMAHEYLHYASYNGKTKLPDLFFEEGLTEYFARQAIKDGLKLDTNLGYPAQVKIITQMTNIIPESELMDVYFSKDINLLTSTLDNVYGDGFYENNKILFATLQYSSNPNETLKLANQIMKKINGPVLKLEDITSTRSKL